MSLISTAVHSTRLVIPRALLLLGGALATAAEPDILNGQQHFARDIYQELVQINTTASVGDTYRVAQAMASRLKAAGFPDEDIHVFETAPQRGNL